MSLSLQNPDSRSLPDGWVEHFDSARHIWYYVDLNTERPRITFAHPCDLDREGPSSAPVRVKEHANQSRNIQRPTGPRKSSTTSLNAIVRETQRARRATVAQQLYATTLSTASPILSSSPVPFDSDQPSLDSEIPSPSSSRSPTVAKNTSSTSHSGTHDPRNVFDCTRLAPGTRRMTVNGSQPSHSPATSQKRSSTYGPAQAFYPSSVNPTPSPNILPIDRLDLMSPGQATPEEKPNSLKTPKITFSGSFSSTTMISSKSSPRDTHTPDHAPISENQDTPLLTNPNILQPKPMRPLKGISLNLQIQVADISESPKQSEDSKNSRKAQILRNFRLPGANKVSSKGKRSHGQDEDDLDGIAPRMDRSLALH